MSLFDLLLRPLRSRVATESYPAAQHVFVRGLRGTPVLDASLCKADQACVTLCPTNAIRFDASPGIGTWQIDYGACVFCGRCVVGCPQDAIVASDDYELAVRAREEAIVILEVRNRI